MARRWPLPGPPRFWVGLAVSAAFLYLAARTVDWGRTATALGAADAPLLCAGAAALVATLVVFAARWRVLLAGTARPGLGEAFSYVMIGYLTNTVMPLRLGDVARAALIARRHGVAGPRVFAGILLERLLDLLVLLALLVGLSLEMQLPPLVRASAVVIGGGALAGLALLTVLALCQERVYGLVARLPGFVPRGPLMRAAAWVDQLAAGLRTLRDAGQLGQVLALSLAAWTIAGAGAYCWVLAFHLVVPWYAGLFVLAVVNLGGAIPSSPGAIGVYHYLAVLALSVWVADPNTALAYAIGTHGINIVLNVALGSACLGREGLSLRAAAGLPAYRSKAPMSGALPV